MEASLEQNSPLAPRDIPEAAKDRPIWRNRAFMWILSGNMISVFGDCFNGIAISLWVLQTTGSAKRMAAVQICYMAVSFLFGSFAGTVADRIDRRRLMLLSDILRSSIAFTLAVCLFVLHAPFVVMLVLVSLSVFSSLFQAPSFHASIVQIVGQKQVQQATSTVHLTDNLSRITGLALAGVVVAVFGGFTAVLMTGITFLLSALCVWMAGTFPPMDHAVTEKSSFFKDWGGGFTYIRRDLLTRAIVILNPLLILFFLSAMMLVQVMAIKDWKAGSIAFGLIEMCIPLGYMIGAGLILAFSARLGKRGWWVFTGLILLGPMYYLISRTSSPHLALPLILMGGALFAFSSMMMQIMLRSEIPIALQGRIYGTLGAITSVAPTFGLAVSAALADQWGAPKVLGGQGLGLFVIAIVLVIWLKPIRTYN